jgi:hypothetical protein
MQRIFTLIQDWPVIVQGALGSALFAILLWIGQKLVDMTPLLVTRISRGRREIFLRNRMIRYQAKASTDTTQKAFYASLLWFRAARDLLRGLIWLTLGLLFTNFVGVWGVIGYLGCLYYLFFALEVVKPIRDEKDVLATKIKETKGALDALAKREDP